MISVLSIREYAQPGLHTYLPTVHVAYAVCDMLPYHHLETRVIFAA